MAFEGVYAADVLGLVLMCSNPDTTYLPVFSAVRLMRIDMYDIGAPSSDIQISQMQLQWNSTQGPAQTETVSGLPCIQEQLVHGLRNSHFVVTGSIGRTLMLMVMYCFGFPWVSTPTSIYRSREY